MNKDSRKEAEKIFKLIKTTLASAKKYNTAQEPPSPFTRRRQMVDLCVTSNTVWSSTNKHVRSYTVKVDGKDVSEVHTHYDVQEVFTELRNLLNVQKKAKGWSGLNFMSESVELESCSWSGYKVSIIPKVCLADAPCSEYKSLMNYINKYGVSEGYGSYPVRMTNYEFFSASMGGKRGVLWDEYGERYFLDNKPRKCERVLGELRKYRKSKDRMVCQKGEENYIDEEERRNSLYYEIECEGEKRRYLKITIKNPCGKIKYETKIY